MSEITENLKEIMNKFDEYRQKWIDKHGTDNGFAEWFTSQITKKENK